MSFQKTFDQLLNEILTDYRNQFPGADTSQGSLIFLKSACTASALWGIYNYQEWIARQIFPDTADPENMEHHAWLREILRRASETDAELLARLLARMRRPPAGGNKYDYVQWALEVDYVAAAWSFPLAQGPGTIDVIITAKADYTGSEVPTSHALTGTVSGVAENKLIDAGGDFTGTVRPGDVAVNDLGIEAEVTAVDSDTQLTLSDDIFTTAGEAYTIKSLTVQVREHIDEKRIPTAKIFRVLPPTIALQDVTMVLEGRVEKVQAKNEVAAYLNALTPNEKMIIDQLRAIAVNNGAAKITSITPSEDVVPEDVYGMIRPGTISII
jgi:hypothetical protein